MKHKVIFLLTFILITTMHYSCTKKEDDTPLSTPYQNDRDLFSCIYDGRTMLIKGATATFSRQKPNNMPIIQIQAQDSDTSQNPNKFYLSFYDIDKIGNYPFKIKSPNDTNFLKWGNSYMATTIVGKKQWIYRGSSGSIQLTKFDTINHIISGNFSTDMIQMWNVNTFEDKESKPENLKDTLLVSSGLFSLQLNVVY